jgi:hypothetical protein
MIRGSPVEGLRDRSAVAFHGLRALKPRAGNHRCFGPRNPARERMTKGVSETAIGVSDSTPDQLGSVAFQIRASEVLTEQQL